LKLVFNYKRPNYVPKQMYKFPAFGTAWRNPHISTTAAGGKKWEVPWLQMFT
jgi:hypothetical protein